MSRFFTSLGAFAVRFRFAIVLAWIAGTFLAVQLLPSLSDVAKDTTSGFLPANSASMRAATLALPFQDTTLAAATLVAARPGGLTAADNTALDALEAQIRGVDKVKVVLDLGVSGDGEARQALVEASSWPSAPDRRPRAWSMPFDPWSRRRTLRPGSTST
jgi:uncharacterized membrane protein YdfJ with MMPL/SSD domain